MILIQITRVKKSGFYVGSKSLLWGFVASRTRRGCARADDGTWPFVRRGFRSQGGNFLKILPRCLVDIIHVLPVRHQRVDGQITS